MVMNKPRMHEALSQNGVIAHVSALCASCCAHGTVVHHVRSKLRCARPGCSFDSSKSLRA